MGLTMAAFKLATKPGGGTPCTMAQVLDALDEKERVVLEEALAAPVRVVGHSAIAKVLEDHEDLKALGLQPSAGSVGYHRRNECRCASA